MFLSRPSSLSPALRLGGRRPHLLGRELERLHVFDGAAELLARIVGRGHLVRELRQSEGTGDRSTLDRRRDTGKPERDFLPKAHDGLRVVLDALQPGGQRGGKVLVAGVLASLLGLGDLALLLGDRIHGLPGRRTVDLGQNGDQKFGKDVIGHVSMLSGWAEVISLRL